MKALSELIEEKRAQLPMQQVMAKKQPAQEVNWIQCKHYVDALPSKFQEIILTALAKGEYIKTIVFNSYTNILLYRRMHGFEVLIEITEDKNKAVRQVVYSAFNNTANMAYIRAILTFEKM